MKGSAAGRVSFLGNTYGRVIAFRVTKPYREPREWWLVASDATKGYCATAFSSRRGAENTRQPGETIIHVREVLE